MTDMKDKLIQAMEPKMIVHVSAFDTPKIHHKKVLELCHHALKFKYETLVDKDHNTIYIGKRN